MTRTFFLGLGGQKCGSTWMQAQLARAPGSDFGRLGEYQVWEGDLGSVFARYRVAEPSTWGKIKGEAMRRLRRPVPARYLRWRMQTDRDEYFDYFARLLAPRDIVRTGDVTPSYAALPAPMLAGIRDGMASRGITTKVMFAMRDPVARLRSHLNMDIAKGRIPPGDETERLAAFYATEEAAARSRYDLTLAALAQEFSQENSFLCLFEEMFTADGIAAFAAFAGIDIPQSAGGTRVNARQTDIAPLPDTLEAEIARHYAPVYHAAAEALPQVATLWPSARHVLTSA
ncbi:sulfotransferase family protein [Pseudaestuariivita atlantica]|uniref:sulfotransferase family protein n=1 Tax=Pseudaestuariivita atlantica TaxID=1317121 RepID=UPI00106B2DD2|nr:sulfotransferase family protein [Pseudaestuariivita atlantica]